MCEPWTEEWNAISNLLESLNKLGPVEHARQSAAFESILRERIFSGEFPFRRPVFKAEGVVATATTIGGIVLKEFVDKPMLRDVLHYLRGTNLLCSPSESGQVVEVTSNNFLTLFRQSISLQLEDEEKLAIASRVAAQLVWNETRELIVSIWAAAFPQFHGSQKEKYKLAFADFMRLIEIRLNDQKWVAAQLSVEDANRLVGYTNHWADCRRVQRPGLTQTNRVWDSLPFSVASEFSPLDTHQAFGFE